MASSPLLRKLAIFAELKSEEISLLNEAGTDVRTTPAKRDIISEGDRPDHLHLIVGGWAARCKVLPNGLRQITAFLLPGDFCDLHVKVLKQMDHSITAITQCRVAWIASDRFDRLTLQHPELTRALWWGTLLDEAILRSWIVNNSRREAYQRIAHLLCELHARAKIVGLAGNDRLDLPLTQNDIADATGLTPVHVNRMLQRLRGDGLITLSGHVLTITDPAGLKQAAQFDDSYLHGARRVRYPA